MPESTTRKIILRDTGVVLHTIHATSLRRAALANLNLSRADLAGVDLLGGDLDGATLTGADLSDANLRDASLKGAVLKSASLSRATLEGANLYGASVRNAALDGANLRGARLDGADFRGANLASAHFEDTSFGNHIPNRHDVITAFHHVVEALTATPRYLTRRIFPITLPVVAVISVFLLLRLLTFEFQYDRTRRPAGWSEGLSATLGTMVTVAAVVAMAVLLWRIIARLGTRDAFEGYLGLLFFFVTGVYLIVALTGYVDEMARETWMNTMFRVMRVLGFAVLTSTLMALYGVPARGKSLGPGRVNAWAAWKAVLWLALIAGVGLALMNARMLSAPFRDQFASIEDVDAFFRHVRIYAGSVTALLALWAILPRLPVPATLARANLRGARLRGANLRGISLRAADLTAADITGAELRHADLREVVLEGAALEGAVFDGTTSWPAGFDAESRGAVRVATPFWHVPIMSLLLRRREF